MKGLFRHFGDPIIDTSNSFDVLLCTPPVKKITLEISSSMTISLSSSIYDVNLIFRKRKCVSSLLSPVYASV